jgi:hypothetical protein
MEKSFTEFFKIKLLLLLTGIGLSPGGGSPDYTTLVQTKKIHKTTTKQQNNYKTIKISTQTGHRTNTYYKHTHTHTHTNFY